MKATPGSCKRGALEIDHVAAVLAFQRQRDPVGSEQRLERRIVVVAFRRDPDLNRIALAAIAADESKGGISAAKLAVDGVNDAAACAMNRVKLNLVKACLQNPRPQLYFPRVAPYGPRSTRTILQRARGVVVNITFLRIGRLEPSRPKGARVAPKRANSYRLDEDGALATRIEGAAIFTSTSSIGFLVQACVT